VLPSLFVPFGGRRLLAWRYYLIMVGWISLHEVSMTMGRRGIPSSLNAHSSLDAVQLISISDQMFPLHPSVSRPPSTATTKWYQKLRITPTIPLASVCGSTYSNVFTLFLPRLSSSSRYGGAPYFPTVGAVLSVRNGVVGPFPSSGIVREGEPFTRF